MSATFTKLQNGTWGVRADGIVEIGSVVQVRTRAGEVKSVTITQVVWTGGGVTIAAIADDRAPRQSSRGSYSGGRRERHCAECEWNQDAGDMNGCPRHRGNPRD